jgi:hypothetical protein
MKILLQLTLIIIFIVACDDKEFENDIDYEINYNDSLIAISGLTLYWDHEVFGKEGRRVRFEFYDVVQHSFDYKLDFRYSLKNNMLDIYLVDTINQGKCAVFPSPDGLDTMCTSRGGFYIPDSLLINGNYRFNLNTRDFKVNCDFNVNDSSYNLIIPDNDNFVSSINLVYPIPKDIVNGSIVFKGSDNIENANKLKEDFLSLGLLETSLPNYPYRHLLVNDDGTPIDDTWPPDNYSFGLVYKSNGITFKQIVETSEKNYLSTDLNIYLYSGMGDQARFSQREGITIVYAGEQ